MIPHFLFQAKGNLTGDARDLWVAGIENFKEQADNFGAIEAKIIKHYDLFRIKNKRDTNDLNIFEKDKNLITFVEWPQLIKDNQEKVIELRFNYENELNNRSVEIIGIN